MNTQRPLTRLILLLLLGLPFSTLAQTIGENPFITRWRCEAGQIIEIPLHGKYAYVWAAADGSKSMEGYGQYDGNRRLSLRAEKAGDYILKAGPEGVTNMTFSTSSAPNALPLPCAHLIAVERWGAVKWKDFTFAFTGCEHMDLHPDAGVPDLAEVRSMQFAFARCASFNQPIGTWDVSKVTDMSFCLSGCTLFNQDLSQWNLASISPTSRIDLSRSGMSVPNYSATLVGWAQQAKLRKNVTVIAHELLFDAEGRKARQKLIDTKGWKFEGDAEAPPIASALSASPERIVLIEGQSYTVQLQLQPFNATVRSVTWRAEQPSIATVSSLGRISALAEGSTTVTATAAGQTLSFAVDVAKAPAPQRILFGYTPGTIHRGARIPLTAQVFPPEAPQGVTWRVEGNGATTEKEGDMLYLSSQKLGWVRVTATTIASPRLSASFDIDVRERPTAHLITLQGPPRLFKGASYQFTRNDYRVYPPDAWPGLLRWSVEGAGATLSPTNLLTAAETGTITVTITTQSDPPLTASCLIDVVDPVAPEHVIITNAPKSLTVGERHPLRVAFLPANASADGEWSLTGEALALSSEAQGTITAVKPGQATVTFTSASAAAPSASATISVLPRPAPTLPTHVRLEQTPQHVVANEYHPVGHARILPPEADQSIEWQCGEGGFITRDGQLIASKPGQLQLTAIAKADPRIRASATIEVQAHQQAQRIEVIAPPATVAAGYPFEVALQVLPMGAPQQLGLRAVAGRMLWADTEWRTPTVHIARILPAGEGTLTLEAFSTLTPTVSTQFTVVVKSPARPESLRLEDTPAKLEVGQAAHVRLAIQPAHAERAVEWRVEGEGEVRHTPHGDGLSIIGKRPGAVTIKATSLTVPTLSATAKLEITATPSSKPVARITLAPTEQTLTPNDTLRLAATIEPEDATNKSLEWSSSSPDIASVDQQGKVTAHAPGEVTIAATNPPSSIQGSCRIMVRESDKPSPVLQPHADQLALSPNPFTTSLTVRHASAVRSYTLRDALGCIAAHGQHDGAEHLLISTSHLPSGLYLLVLHEVRRPPRTLRAVKR